MEKRRGISLVVLIVTIVVIIILSGAAIISVLDADLITDTTKTAFKNNVNNYLEEYNSWLLMKKMKYRGNFEQSKVNVSSTLPYNGEYIQNIIKSITEYDLEKFEIIGGKLVYTGNGITNSDDLAKETKWAEEAGVYILSKALGEEDTIVFTDTEIESAYDNIRLYGDSSNGTDGLSEITLTVTQNLIDNGFGEYKDNREFGTTVDNLPNQKVKGGISAFSLSYTKWSESDRMNSFVEINLDKKYELSMYVRPNMEDLRMYSGIVEYDIDKKNITPRNCYYVPNTLTYLTQDLENGDTVVYLNDVSNFKSDDNTPDAQLGFIFWNYKDSTGYLYPAGTYSRNVWRSLYTYNNIDKTNNTITLKSAWNNGTIKAGTSLSQSNDGATYNYSLMSGEISNTTWEYRHATIDGVNNNTLDHTKFRPVTKYINWYMMVDYSNESSEGATVANIIFAESDKYNKEYTIDMTGHDPLRTMEDGTSDYIDYKNKRIVRRVGVSGSTLYKLTSETYEAIELPTLPIYEGNTAITLNQTGRLEGTYVK